MQRLLTAAKALADEKRLRIVVALQKRELCVCELCDALELPQSTLSTHLLLLLRGQIVTKRMEGKWAYYSLHAGFRPAWDAWLKLYRAELQKDKLLGTDKVRLQQRLEIREDGSCCQGFRCAAPRAKSKRLARKTRR